MAVEIPDKLYFKIGEVARIVGVEPYVLRYWEREFTIVRPGKTRSRQRLFRRRDVELLVQIRRLLHEERYTIEGAKRRLREMAGSGGGDGATPTTAELREVLVHTKAALQELRAHLDGE